MKNGWIIDCNIWRHYVNDKLHREDGPAAINEYGSKFWLKNGKLHREDGPAIEYSDGTKEWWYHETLIGGSVRNYTQEQFEAWLKFKAFL